ncbi:MAG TPA: glycosyltransferase family 9 protein [Phycisphaerales bacterium]|nr:glycosyltransferase family 9 protein [Phycisphaerales bacterium]HMP36459.1 glycosyltransferase family 9 protein [Phycisphaerales bacterium]
MLPSWVGDVVMAEPTLRALRAARGPRPILAFGRPGLAALVEGRALFDGVIEHAMRGLTGPFAAARLLRARGVETVLLLPNSFRSAAAAAIAGTSHRIGFRGQGRRALLTRAIKPPPRRPPVAAVDWYATLAERGLGLRVEDRLPRLRPTEAQRRESAGLLEGVPRPYVLLNPGANRADKRWPSERFVAVARGLRERGFSVVVSGGPSESALVGEIAAASDAVDLAARGVRLGSLVGAIAEAAAVISNDTGPRHIAIGCGAPAISLFGPTDPRWSAIPGAAERAVVAEPFLLPELVADDLPRVARIDRIAVGDVLAAFDALVGQRP